MTRTSSVNLLEAKVEAVYSIEAGGQRGQTAHKTLGLEHDRTLLFFLWVLLILVLDQIDCSTT